jgi:hypothetical protein
VGREGSSLARFDRVAGRLQARARDAPVASALAVLDSVRFPESTQWNVVYEPAARRVHFRTRRHESLKTVSLDAFAPGCDQPVMVLDLASDEAGDVSGRFVPYTEKANGALVEATLAPFLRKLPPGAARRAAELPATTACER